MDLNERGHNEALDIPDSGPGWRRVAFPVPPLGKLVKGTGVGSRLGTCTGSGLAGWVATGHTHGEITWATVVLALAMIAADAVQARKSVCSSPRG
ncbi:hypothetical protein ACF08B_00085 [Streptomyces sp. NPDC015139]|uniref:hypothetical protein n=1 Tax=Streptomyces sp. NPDC015139 TaxID=3364942 RepID=UPI0036FE4744